MNFFLLLNTKYDMLKNVGNQTVDGPIDFHSMGAQKYESQWGSSKVWLPHIVQNIFFCVQQKKGIHTGLEKLEGRVNK